MPTILIFKETLLPPSETFILAQMRALKRFSPQLVGLERVRNGLSLGENPILLTRRASKVAALRAKLYRRTGFAPLFHHRIKQLRPDLIHAHFASGGKTLLPLNRALQRPLIVTLHGGSDVPTDGPHVGVYRKLAEKASLFLCVSEFIRREAIAAGFPPEKLLVHYIGIDRTTFVAPLKPADVESVLFVGRLVEMKGCEYLLHAMRIVQTTRPSCTLTIIGDGPLRPELERLAANLKVGCLFMGLQPAGVVRQMLKQCRLLSLPSVVAANGDTEGLPTVLIEAQAMGIPVVSTYHAGIPECVADGVTGILVPERDNNALAVAILKLLEDSNLWERCHYATQSHIDNQFDLQKQTAVLEDIYAAQMR